MKNFFVSYMLLTALVFLFSGCYNITVKPTPQSSGNADKLHQQLDKEVGK